MVENPHKNSKFLVGERVKVITKHDGQYLIFKGEILDSRLMGEKYHTSKIYQVYLDAQIDPQSVWHDMPRGSIMYIDEEEIMHI